jgi:tRNA(Ile)-lysidine synthase
VPRSHPPTLITLTRALLRDAQLVPRGARVLLAVSGGPDSMALLDVLARLRADGDFSVVAHGVDHGLRESAAAELDLAEAFARSRDIPFSRTRVTVALGGNLQARARSARYTALQAAAHAAQCSLIATAHHADDRAETFLLRLLRGTSPRGLAVLPPRVGDRVRPFLRARRADIDAHLERHAIPFAVDPSNRDPRFARTRVRQELLPLLEQLSPKIVDNLCSLADELSALAPGIAPETDAGVLFTALPRATRQSLARMIRTRAAGSRVLLPGGLVAAFDQAKLEIVVEDGGAPHREARPRRSESGQRPKGARK